MSHQGDLHNFGQCVRAVERASGIYFQKPRPIYWEWLFFGRESPLAPFFELNSDRGLAPGQCLFNLDVEMADDFTGCSRQVLPGPDNSIGPGHAYSLGVLLAYCYVFGIRDLHRNNIVATTTHLQVVDAEVVFTKILLPNETLLLPFRNIGPDLAASNHLGPDASALSSTTVSAILSGYCDTFDCMISNLTDLQRVFSERQSEISRIPARHIMRDTPEYRQWDQGVPEIPFCDDELAQLRRGDIPYYFKFVGDPKLYRYTDKMGAYSPVSSPADFAKAIGRDAAAPSELLTSERVDLRLFPTGLLFLAKHLWHSSKDENFNGSSGVALSQISDTLSLSIRSRRYQASRS